MSTLVTESRLADPDRSYRAMIEAHRGLSDEDSAALNSRLVLILANHIGEHAVLQEAIALAKRSMGTAKDSSE
ncbi:MAG: topoisomerase [Microvirga sp.]|nr:topoisomerase [Microvirga sp.]